MKNTKQTKQVVSYTVITYIGIVIGIVSNLFIYPLDVELLGVFRYIDSWAQMLFPVITLGSAQALIHFFPQLPVKMQVQLFGFSLLSIFKIAFWVSLFVVLLYFFGNIVNTDYIFYSLPIAIVLALLELFKRQATTLQKLAVPTLYEKIVPKVALLSTFSLIFYGFVSANVGLILYVFFFLFLIFGVALYVKKHYNFNLNFSERELFFHISKKEYYKYSLYAFAGSFGSFFAFRIDSIMIPNFISLEANGIYNIGVTLASTLAIPATGIFALQAPIISKYIKNEDWQSLRIKYTETAKLLLFVASIFYGAVLLGMEPFFNLLPTQSKLLPALPIIYILGGSMFINMSTGFNSEIISYSKYYRFNLITILLLVILNTGLNYYILQYTNKGIIGVAYASLISMTCFNAIKTIFIFKTFKLLPFDANYFKIVFVVGLSFIIAYYMPQNSYVIVNLFLKALVFVTLCTFLVYKLKLVNGLNQFVANKFKF